MVDLIEPEAGGAEELLRVMSYDCGSDGRSGAESLADGVSVDFRSGDDG